MTTTQVVEEAFPFLRTPRRSWVSWVSWRAIGSQSRIYITFCPLLTERGNGQGHQRLQCHRACNYDAEGPGFSDVLMLCKA